MRKVATTESEIVQFRQAVQTKLRQRVREAIETVLDEELAAALGCEAYQRCEGRRGYRNGSEQRPLTTEIGTRAIRVPRGRLRQDDGTTAEFRSELLPRYARRTKVIDEAILGIYLAGANSRRIRKALEPLLGTAHLSKSAVSRVVARLKALFESWNERDLSEERYAILYVDGFHLKVRLARRVVSVPVLAVLGVAEDGTKVLVSLRLAASEAPSHWSGVLLDLQRRGLVAPALLVVDGHSGLRKALESWPEVQVQRCTRHKLVNLIEHCPVHARAELKRDYRGIVNAKDGMAGRKAYEAFLAKGTTLCPAVARSLEEAGSELLTFYAFPKSMWRSLRTTNPLENLNREFRRRTKTQASFGTEQAGVTLLCGLVAFGQIRFHKNRRSSPRGQPAALEGDERSMRLAMESQTGGMPLCGLGATATERVGATRSHDVEVGHTMGPLSERSHAASRNAITPRRLGLTTGNRLRYTSSTEATPELFHGTRDTTRRGPGRVKRLPSNDESQSEPVRNVSLAPGREFDTCPGRGANLLRNLRISPSSTELDETLEGCWLG